MKSKRSRLHFHIQNVYLRKTIGIIKYIQLLKCHPINYGHSVNRYLYKHSREQCHPFTQKINGQMLWFSRHWHGKQEAKEWEKTTQQYTKKKWINPTFCVSFHQMCFGSCYCSKATLEILILYHCRGYVDLSWYCYWRDCRFRLHKHLHLPKIRYTKIYWTGFTDVTLVSNSEV